MTDRQNTEIDSNLASTQTCDLSVRNMRKGYKKTKLGWIPEDWVVTELGKIGQVVSGLTYSPQDVNDNGTLVLRSSNVQKENLSFEDTVYVDTDGLSYNPVIENDILICVRNGSKHLIGKNTLITKEVEGVAFGAFMSVFRSDLNNYLIQYFKTDIYNKEIHKNLGATINSINGSELKRFKVPLPPRSERQKIATILSTWDRAIAKQQQLIAAKQEFKKGLMQLLLTGKKRFEGFEGEWEEIKIGQYSTMYSGGTPSRAIKDYYGGDIPWIKSGELNQRLITNVEESITELALKNSSTKMVEKGTLLLALYGATAGVVAITDVKGAINQAILAIETNAKLDKMYLFYLLKIKMPQYLKNLVQGGQPNLNGGMIKKLKIKKPLIKEQQKIASVLSAADKEIGLLQSELAQLRGQKRGLMQRLLTGEVRVKIN